MLFTADACQITVSILQAVVFGAGDACIDLSLPSLLGGVAVFIAGVVVLRYLGALVLRRIFPALRRKKDLPGDCPSQISDDGLKPLPYESPIRSTGAWGGKAR